MALFSQRRARVNDDDDDVKAVRFSTECRQENMINLLVSKVIRQLLWFSLIENSSTRRTKQLFQRMSKLLA